MYKGASKNIQHHAETVALFSTKAHGVDPTTWKDADQKDLAQQRETLFALKSRMQLQQAEIETRLSRARAIAQESGRYLPAHVYNQLQSSKLRLLQDLHQVDTLLRQIQLHAVEKPRERLPIEVFYEAFYAQAESMLAGPVFERIRIAAHHRVGAAAEES